MGKGLNPADVHRREMKKKQMKRNKNERKLQREVRADIDQPEKIKAELQTLLASEGDAAEGSKAVSLKRQVYQKAYGAALIRQKERQAQAERDAAARASRPAPPTQSDPMLAGLPPDPLAPGPSGRPLHRHPPRPKGPPPANAARFLPRGMPPPAPMGVGGPGMSAPPVPRPDPAVTHAPPPGPVRTTLSAAPDLKIKRAEKSEGLIAMVPASLRRKPQAAAGGGGGGGGGSGWRRRPLPRHRRRPRKRRRRRWTRSTSSSFRRCRGFCEGTIH